MRRSFLPLLAALLAPACAHQRIHNPIDLRQSDPERVSSAREPPNDWFVRQRMSGGEAIPVNARSAAFAEWKAKLAGKARGGGITAGKTGASADEPEAGIAPGTWTFAGPSNVGGRVTALAVDPNNANHFWLGAADGGVFTSMDGGASWTFAFAGQTALSIGSIATHPTSSNIVYVGTGEDNGGGYSYDGEGVFKTTDGGATWTNVGLGEVRRIGRIAIDPSNPQRVFVAAGGGVFNKDVNRGVYRSTDGGATWQKVLFLADDTGAIDVAIDPSNPNRIYAAMWTRTSTNFVWTAGGINSGIWQSTNGGDTWTQLTNGLPAASSTVGRIGLAIAHSSPNVVYAIYRDNPGYLLGIWKSSNSGASWNRVYSPPMQNNYWAAYGYYFGQIRVDPSNASTVYALDIYWYVSTNSGGSFARKDGGGIYVDHHDLVIQPGRLNMGNDAGFYWTTNGGSAWSGNTSLPISQFYDLGIDKIQPQRRFGGAQDRGTVRTTSGGTADWNGVLGGDGLQCEVDPIDSSRVYASTQWGDIYRSTDGGTSFTKATTGIDIGDRNNWNSPVAHDPQTSQRLYIGTQRVYRSVDGAQTWTPISSDLTNGSSVAATTLPGKQLGDRSHLADTAGGTVSAIGVSPVDTNVIWAGTDDGNVWVTSNGGGSWTRVNAPGMSLWVTRVTGDPFDAQAAYVTYSGYRAGSKLPHILRTTDLGASWTDISGDLPAVPLNCVTADPDWLGRLFVCSDLGVFVTDDWGQSWSAMSGGMPLLVVQDLVLHQGTRTLFAATHGRSMWSYDLSQLPPPDRDGDGHINVQDCAPDDAGAFAPPGEVVGVRFSEDRMTLSWSSAAPNAGAGTVHDVLRGLIDELPVGGGPTEACLNSGNPGTAATDSALPGAGMSYWYLVRGSNSCEAGTYGTTSGGTTRSSEACQ